ncbi:MAG: hypothetical protein ABJA82_00525 [Myxococcales bacterium]
MPIKYVPPHERRAMNRGAIYHQPEPVRLVAPTTPEQPTLPKDTTMENPTLTRTPPTLRWPVALLVATAAAVLGWLMLVPSGCQTITGNPTVQDAGHIVADCAAAEVHDIALHALDDVTTAIAETDYNGAIRDVAGRLITQLTGTLGARAAGDVWQGIKCVVAEIQQKTNVQLGYGKMAYGDAVRLQTMNQHANAWLAAH